MVFSVAPLRILTVFASQLAARTLDVYTESPFNLLDYLGNCTDAALVCWIALTRLSLLFLMWFSRTVAPVIFRAPGNSFIFDTGEELYDDARFAMVRHWDGVHMFFIAHYGYLYENQFVFFPGLPALIRGVQYVTQKAIPLLHQIAPVAFYVCLINVAASCVAGVVLRRLATVTFLGPEAVRYMSCWGRKQTVAAAGPVATENDYHRITEATIHYRLLHGLTGTSLDVADPQASRPATMKELRSAVRRRRRIIGGTVLVWITTPAMVFTVAIYTESLFALTTILGIYWLAWYEPLPWLLQEHIADWLAPSVGHLGKKSAERGTGDSPRWIGATRKADEDAVAPPVDELLRELTGGSEQWPQIVWRQAFSTRAEVAAVLLFTLAATLRSNAFTCAGFLAFPIVVQLVLPKLHAAQCKTTLVGQYAAAILKEVATPATAASTTVSTAAPLGKELEVLPRRHTTKIVEAEPLSSVHSPPHSPNLPNGKKVVCLTLSCPQRGLPNPFRILVILLECAMLLLPYMAINYLGYHRFVTQMWNPAARAQIGSAFWQLYPMLQKKYWNVSFLSAYSLTNLPNVILALPVAVLVAISTYSWYLAPAWEARASAKVVSGTKSTSTATSRWSHLCDMLMPLIRSSNVVHLLALLALALSKMHVQVTNRFVMSSPALYFLLGAQLAMKPTSLLSQFVLLWSILWSFLGGILFANHLPWT